jgi:signal transduction histidine kinase
MSGIAHDFNNILATISGYAEILQEDYPDKPSVKEITSKIRLAVDKAKTLTGQMLKSDETLKLENVVVDLNEVLRETIEFVRSTAKPGISIRAEYCRQDAFVLADPVQLFRVFLNLMTNCIQSMEKNEGRLSVSTSVVEGGKEQGRLKKAAPAHKYIRTRIRDNGKGMDQALIGRIFEPFFTTRGDKQGTGLGLSVVYGIVSGLGGDIHVSGKPDHGSVFDVYLPLYIAEG